MEVDQTYLDDASRKWNKSVENVLISLGMTKSLMDNCLFFYRKNDHLQYQLVIHVDDFLTSGTEMFKAEMVAKLREKYSFGKVSNRNFVYTGLNVHLNAKSEIFVDQEDFLKKIEMQQFSKQNLDAVLKTDENRMVRKLKGQLSWAASQTRPDLALDSLQRSTILNRSQYKNMQIRLQ